jgi:hypothetical protein
VNSELWAGFLVATGLWIVLAAAAVSGPFGARSEIWIATSSDKITSHPTLVRAAYPKFAAQSRPMKIAVTE